MFRWFTRLLGPRCSGCFIDWFQFHHDIRSDCPLHYNEQYIVLAYTIDGRRTR